MAVDGKEGRGEVTCGSVPLNCSLGADLPIRLMLSRVRVGEVASVGDSKKPKLNSDFLSRRGVQSNTNDHSCSLPSCDATHVTNVAFASFRFLFLLCENLFDLFLDPIVP